MRPTHNEDMKIRSEQVSKVVANISNMLRKMGLTFCVVHKANYGPSAGFLIHTTAIYLKDLCNALNTKANAQNSILKFHISKYEDDIEWAHDILFATWCPYFWLDEMSNFHKLYDLDNLNKIEQQYDVFGVFRSDDMPNAGDVVEEKAIYIPEYENHDYLIWHDAKFYADGNSLFVDNGEGRIAIFCDGLQVGVHFGEHNLFEEHLPPECDTDTAVRALNVFANVAKDNGWNQYLKDIMKLLCDIESYC